MEHAGIARPKSLIVAHLLLLLDDRPRHGYELAESLRAWDFEGITTSTVYRELARLEKDAIVRSFWQASQARGPARHMYELTPCGREELARCAGDIRSLIKHLTAFLSLLGEPDRRPDAPAPAPVADREPVGALRRLWRSR